jgi:ABC-type multidrug transport system permease subunit
MSAVAILGAIAFLDALFNYFWTGNGIHGTEGALLVVISTFLLALAAGLIAARWLSGWLRGLFEVLIALDLVGTGCAAYLLDAWILLGLVILAAIAWLVHILRPTPHLAPTRLAQ